MRAWRGLSQERDYWRHCAKAYESRLKFTDPAAASTIISAVHKYAVKGKKAY